MRDVIPLVGVGHRHTARAEGEPAAILIARRRDPRVLVEDGPTLEVGLAGGHLRVVHREARWEIAGKVGAVTVRLGDKRAEGEPIERLGEQNRVGRERAARVEEGTVVDQHRVASEALEVDRRVDRDGRARDEDGRRVDVNRGADPAGGRLHDVDVAGTLLHCGVEREAEVRLVADLGGVVRRSEREDLRALVVEHVDRGGALGVDHRRGGDRHRLLPVAEAVIDGRDREGDRRLAVGDQHRGRDRGLRRVAAGERDEHVSRGQVVAGHGRRGGAAVLAHRTGVDCEGQLGRLGRGEVPERGVGEALVGHADDVPGDLHIVDAPPPVVRAFAVEAEHEGTAARVHDRSELRATLAVAAHAGGRAGDEPLVDALVHEGRAAGGVRGVELVERQEGRPGGPTVIAHIELAGLGVTGAFRSEARIELELHRTGRHARQVNGLGGDVALESPAIGGIVELVGVGHHDVARGKRKLIAVLAIGRAGLLDPRVLVGGHPALPLFLAAGRHLAVVDRKARRRVRAPVGAVTAAVGHERQQGREVEVLLKERGTGGRGRGGVDERALVDVHRVGVVEFEVGREIDRHLIAADRHVRRPHVHRHARRAGSLPNDVDVALALVHVLVEREHQIAGERDVRRAVERGDARHREGEHLPLLEPLHAGEPAEPPRMPRPPGLKQALDGGRERGSGRAAAERHERLLLSEIGWISGPRRERYGGRA